MITEESGIARKIKALADRRQELKAELKANEAALKAWVRAGGLARLSEHEMAGLAHVNQATISKWISGKTYLEQTPRQRAKTGYCSFPGGPCLKEASR